MRRHLHAPSLFLALLVGVGCVAAPVDEVLAHKEQLRSLRNTVKRLYNERKR